MPALEDYLHPFKNAYRASPRWVKATAGLIYAQVPRRIRYGPTLGRASRILAQSERWSAQRLREHQWAELSRLLEHAYSHVPYYRRTWTEAGVTPAQIKIPEDLERLPLLTKEDVRRHRSDLIADNYRSKLLAFNSGGSTGEPLEFFWEKGRTRALERAFMWRQWRWAGFEFGQRTAVLRGQTVREGVHYDPIDRHLFLSGLNIGDETASTYLEALREFQPVSLQAYPSAATVLANYMKRKDEPPIAGLRVVLCGSENLYPAQRALLEEVFQCRVYSWYGLGEAVCLAGGCEHSDLYHVYPEYGYTELVRPDGGSLAWEPGTTGEIVGTGFNNWAMPLIRYRTGDVAVVSSEGCPCGRNYPLWERIEGRKQEYVVAADGSLVPLTAFIFGQHYHAFDKILRLQVVQDKPQALRVRLIVVPEWVQDDERRLLREMGKALGSGWHISVEYPDQIERTRAGKHRFVLQNLPLDGTWAGEQSSDSNTEAITTQDRG